MRRTIILIIFWCGCLAAMCQEPLPLLTPQQMPNPIRFLPPPPDTASAAFEYDKAQYRWVFVQFCPNFVPKRKIPATVALQGLRVFCPFCPFCPKVSGRKLKLACRDEEELRYNGSYPSGHTIEGWSAALVLMELNPERADTILARGYMYGESRVIAGYHWQSDVDAGRLAASAAIARLHADKRFQRLMRKARREYRRLSGRCMF